ncbi:hypothetical protein [Azoarcus sp. DN11]|uniref:hypothetical protein n=1 Tax=Azoarcus sp. DN11 TaxID=356837 RepID=UPI000EAC9591|nr:hypothetical protein [Azoarcus sp. DN11]AYH41851.1 hypothetical protein CDA09_00355 [Azoarcus sp. DN11]
MKTRIPYVIAAACAAVLLAGCGEKSQVAKYEHGKYAGKSDTRPWEGGVYKGDKGAWEQALRNRIRTQNEYKRVE